MKALVYRTTKSPVQGWASVHEKAKPNAANACKGLLCIFVSRPMVPVDGPLGLLLQRMDSYLYTNPPKKKKDGPLSDWVTQFGAENVEQSNLDVGATIEGVWRPGLYYDLDILQGLGETNLDLRLAEQALLLLIQRLDELLLFVEPTTQSLSAHSHKARELLILACTEVEAQWKHYLRRGGLIKQVFTTNDYIALRSPLHLEEYEISLPRYKEVPPIRPFLGWSTVPGPTQTLPWYDAYNKTKHDSKEHFPAANVLACLQAVAANIVMFCVRFGPFRLHQGGGMLSALFNLRTRL